MHKKAVLKLASGFRGRAGNCIRIARERVERALQYATRDRRAKKRDVRSLWIARINAGAREHGLTYSTFIAGLKADNIALNRKILSDFAEKEPLSFGALAARVRELQEKGVGGGGGSKAGAGGGGGGGVGA